MNRLKINHYVYINIINHVTQFSSEDGNSSSFRNLNTYPKDCVPLSW